MTESKLHIAMKQWIADKYIDDGISISDIEFEKKFYEDRNSKDYYHRFSHTIADVFINSNGGIAVYCELKTSYPWLYDFIEKRLPILKRHCKEQIVVLPENLEMISPMRFKDYYKQLTKENVGVFVAPCSVDVKNKQQIRIDMTYKSLEKLCKIKNRFCPDRLLVDFIENDLEKIVVR